jgi:exosortase/archaeosortase family protein
MLLMFFAYTTAAALVIQRPLVDRLLVVFSALPIALGANVGRIVATGLLYVTAGGEWARMVYHDLAGWLMMPLALAALWAEIGLLARLFVEPDLTPPTALALLAHGAPEPRRGAAEAVEPAMIPNS